MTSLRLTIRQHLSIIIVGIVIIALSLNFYYVPNVEADLAGPYFVRGYIYNSSGDPISSGKTVTITNNNNGNNYTTDTLLNGAYQINVGKDTGFDCSDGHQIVVNCSNNSEVGENDTNIDISATFAWCNLTGNNKLEPQDLSINVTPWTWNAGDINYSSYNNTSNTYFNLTNQGNVKINVSIHAEDIPWGSSKWNLTNTTALNNFTLKYQKSSEDAWTNITLTNTSFKTNLQYNSQYFSYTYWQLFGLNITMPASSDPSPSGTLQVNATFWSIIA